MSSSDKSGLVSLTIQIYALGLEGLGVKQEGHENWRTVEFDWRKLFWVSLILPPFIKGQTRTDFVFR